MPTISDRHDRFYNAVLAVNQMMVTVRDEHVLYRELCRVLVEDGGLVLVWVGRVDQVSLQVKPICNFGAGGEFLNDVLISVDQDIPQGRGPTGIAWREGRPKVVNRYREEPAMLPWREVAQRYGWRSSAAFPVFRQGKIQHILGLYHQEEDAFDDEVIRLVSALTQTVSFALENLDHENLRKDMEIQLRQVAQVYEFSSQPMLVLDESGRILSANHAYETMCGYLLDELVGKHPPVFDETFQFVLHARSGGLLANQNSWQGRVWGRRRNGDSFPQWMVINVVPKTEASAASFVATVTDMTDRMHFEDTIWRQANLDLLTGLPNRFLFHTRLTEEMVRAHNQEDVFPLVLFVDIDQFKQVNEFMGHHTGDCLLMEIAGRIRGCAGERTLAARLGGDEFAVMFSAMSEAEQHKMAHSIGECLVDGLRQPYALVGSERSLYMSASVGVATYPRDAGSTETLLQKAEQAMYAAKSAGRNQMVFYTRGMQEQAVERLNLMQDLRSALAEQQLFLEYQPIIRLKDGHLVKAEALLRWRNPRRGLVSPGEFIPLAEESGAIIAMGDWVFRTSADWVKQTLQRLGDEFQVSINMSPVQFRDPNVSVANWLQYLQAMGLESQHVVVEITEGLLMDASEEVSRKLLDFRNAGVQVALDDFGTGYSTLSYLRRFDIDYLKIDRVFVSSMTHNSSDAALVEAIVAMAHKLGLKVIAEGVETDIQHEMLRQIGCDYGQGFWYSRPLDDARFQQLSGRFPLQEDAA